MSKFVDEIVKDIRENPRKWRRYGERGLMAGEVVIDGLGNTKALSICDVLINGRDSYVALTWFDKYRIESACLWWMRNASLELMKA